MAEMRSIEAVLHEEIDKLEELSRKDIGLTGTPSGLRGHRRPHRRLPARQPDRAGRPALDGQDHARHEHRRERRDRPRQAGRAVLARDVRDRAGPPLHRLPGQGVERRAAQGPGARPTAGRRCCSAVEKLAAAPIFIDDSSDIGVLEMRAKARRLHARHGGLGLIVVDYLQLVRAGRPLGQPRRAGRPDQPWAEDPRPRARHPGGRRVAALARGRVAPPADADALRPARERPARAGRRRRHVRLPRGVLRQGVRAPGRGRHHLRQAPQRARSARSRSPSCRSTRGSPASTATTAASPAAPRRRNGAG